LRTSKPLKTLLKLYNRCPITQNCAFKHRNSPQYMSSSVPQHLSSELAFANQQANTLQPAQLIAWHKCRSGHTFQAFQGKQIVAYILESDVPKILKVLACEDFSVSLRDGSTSTWIDDSTLVKHQVTHLPIEVAPNCFMWHLQHTTLDYNEYRGRYNIKFNVAFRTASNPSTRESGKVYLMEYATFRAQYAVTQ